MAEAAGGSAACAEQSKVGRGGPYGIREKARREEAEARRGTRRARERRGEQAERREDRQ